MSDWYSTSPISSPCVMICKLNPKGVCVGCGRSREQIAGWLSYSEPERKVIMAQLRTVKTK